jgi:hypothetical protein
MAKRFIPRLGLERIDHDLVDQVRKLRAQGITDQFEVVRGGRRYQVTHRSDADLYRRMMAAKGLEVNIG